MVPSPDFSHCGRKNPSVVNPEQVVPVRGQRSRERKVDDYTDP
jgi:hypothetical protein